MRIFIRTSKTGEIQHYINTYSICSVARPRPNCLRHSGAGCFISIHSVARPRLCRTSASSSAAPFQSTRSQDRDLPFLFLILILIDFNPLGRKTETTIPFFGNSGPVFQSTRSQDRDVHCVPLRCRKYHFNPLGRKTETENESRERREWGISIHSVARPRLITIYLSCMCL